MIKALLLTAQFLLPTPDAPRAQASFNLMVTDFATCHAYFDLRADYYKIDEPLNAMKSLGAMATMAYEGKRLEALANLPQESFNKRRKAAMANMQGILDSHSFATLYSKYDGECEELRENPGGAFIKHLNPEMKG